VRVIQKAQTAGRSALVWVLIAMVAIGALVAWRLLAQQSDALPASNSETVSGSAPFQPATTTPQRIASLTARSTERPQATDLPNGDPNDLANYFRPGDPVPTGAELIGALHDVGIHTGIGAFNPPGTSPPLEGLAVPEGFDLPEGYVRHHQSTDEGVAIEPILMFAPDVTLHDASGRPIAMPANRVVPIDLAPPGLPVRWVHIPRP
jgi:hypothetical protein